MDKGTLLKNIGKLLGKKVLFIFAASVVAGMLLGMSEMIFGFAVQNFLASFDLVKAEGIPRMLVPFTVIPILFLVVVVIIRSFLSLLSFIITYFSVEAFNFRIRNLLVANTLGSSNERDTLSIAEVSHITGNLTLKSSEFVFYICRIATAFAIMVTILGGLALLQPFNPGI